MPWAPKRVCVEIGCGRLVDRGRCDLHTKQQRRRAATERPSSSGRGYDRAWQRVRAQYLARHPWCECGQSATEVHHIVPLCQGGTHGEGNIRAMCKACHSTVTAKSTGYGKR